MSYAASYHSPSYHHSPSYQTSAYPTSSYHSPSYHSSSYHSPSYHSQPSYYASHPYHSSYHYEPSHHYESYHHSPQYSHQGYGHHGHGHHGYGHHGYEHGHEHHYPSHQSYGQENHHSSGGLVSAASLLIPLLGLIGLSLLVPNVVGLRAKREIDEGDDQRAQKLMDVYTAVLSSEDCIRKLFCEMGHLAKNSNDQPGLFKLMERVVPPQFEGEFNILKESTRSPTSICEKYKCNIAAQQQTNAASASAPAAAPAPAPAPPPTLTLLAGS